MNGSKPNLNDLRIQRDNVPASNGRSKVLITIAFGLVVLAGVWFFGFRSGAPEVEVAVAREIGAGTVASGSPSDRTVLNASGYVTARREATVSSKVTGKIVEVLIEEGMEVEADQLLARLDASNLTASLRLAEAQVAATTATLNETQVRLDEAGREQRRILALTNSGVASSADLDRAESDVRSLEAVLVRQRREVEVSERQLAVWEQQLADTEIRAPFRGVVVSKDAQPGEMISPVSAGGGFTRTGICTVVDMTSLEIEVDVNEAYITRVQSGQPVTATLDAYPDWSIPAHVIAIVPTADRQKATVRVRIGFVALDSRILPEMGVKVAFQEPANGENEAAGERGSVVSLPPNAVWRDGSRDVVWVIRGGRVERRAVRVGSRGADAVLVMSGLAAGERVAVRIPDSLVLEDGEKVEVKR